MRYSQLLGVLDEAGLSPEQAAGELGVSGMTLRRWRAKAPGAALPEMYRRAFEPLLRRLIGEGRVHPEDPNIASAFAPADDPFQKALFDAGITHAILEKGARDDDGAVVRGIARIGEDANRQAQVKNSGKMMARFKAMGSEWRSRIDDLTLALKSDRLTALDKLVAFGALFYLITPFDLIPDAIPVFGLMDDFIILGLAVMYYRKRFPHLFSNRKGGGKK